MENELKDERKNRSRKMVGWLVERFSTLVQVLAVGEKVVLPEGPSKCE